MVLRGTAANFFFLPISPVNGHLSERFFRRGAPPPLVGGRCRGFAPTPPVRGTVYQTSSPALAGVSSSFERTLGGGYKTETLCSRVCFTSQGRRAPLARSFEYY